MLTGPGVIAGPFFPAFRPLKEKAARPPRSRREFEPVRQRISSGRKRLICGKAMSSVITTTSAARNHSTPR